MKLVSYVFTALAGFYTGLYILNVDPGAWLPAVVLTVAAAVAVWANDH